VQQLVDTGVGVAVLVVNERSAALQPVALGAVDGRRHPYRSRRVLRRARALEPVDIPVILANAARAEPRLTRLVTRLLERMPPPKARS